MSHREPVVRAGVARRAITPPVGVDLTGYVGRPGPSARVHDELYATAVMLDDGTTRIGIVSLDIVGIGSGQDAALRKGICEAADIDPANLLIACSHTHSGPATMVLRGMGERDENYLKWAHSQIVTAASKAGENLRDASLSFAQTQSDLGINRRNWVIDQGIGASETSGRITDPQLSVLVARTSAGDSIALFNYACHGTVMNFDNVEVSSDWIGAARDILEESPSIKTAVFLQGCCGNINPRFGRTFEDVNRAGERVARPLLEALPDMEPVQNPTFKVAWKSVELPFLPLPSIEALEQEISFLNNEIQEARSAGGPAVQLRAREALLLWAQDACKVQDSGSPMHVTVPLQAISMGNVTILAIPGEVFCEIGLAIKKMSKSDIMVVGYANGNIGYIPTAEAYREGGYEVEHAFKRYGLKMIGPKSEEIILGAARSLLAEVGR